MELSNDKDLCEDLAIAYLFRQIAGNKLSRVCVYLTSVASA